MASKVHQLLLVLEIILIIYIMDTLLLK